jgi:hypothetical protein
MYNQGLRICNTQTTHLPINIMAQVIYVTAQRNRDLASQNHGKLNSNSFKFHKAFVNVDWFEGEVRLKFPSWAIAQKAVNQLRAGDATLWDTYVVER